jgi:hypothetical protein
MTVTTRLLSDPLYRTAIYTVDVDDRIARAVRTRQWDALCECYARGTDGDRLQIEEALGAGDRIHFDRCWAARRGHPGSRQPSGLHRGRLVRWMTPWLTRILVGDATPVERMRLTRLCSACFGVLQGVRADSHNCECTSCGAKYVYREVMGRAILVEA